MPERVSTMHHKDVMLGAPAPRLAALKSPGCWDRPELHQFLDQLRKGDVLVVWKLDRLSRSLHNEAVSSTLSLRHQTGRCDNQAISKITIRAATIASAILSVLKGRSPCTSPVRAFTVT